MTTQLARMKQRRGTSAQWASTNPVLADGEIAVVEDSGVVQMKIGDGVRHFNDLPLFAGGPNDVSELVYDLWVVGSTLPSNERLVRATIPESTALTLGAWDSNDLGPGRWRLHGECQAARIDAGATLQTVLFLGDGSVPATIEFAFLVLNKIVSADGSYPASRIDFAANSIAPTALNLDTGVVVIGTDSWNGVDVDPADYAWDGTTLQVKKQGLYSISITVIGTTP